MTAARRVVATHAVMAYVGRGKVIFICVGTRQKVSGLPHAPTAFTPRKHPPVSSWGEGQGRSQPSAALKNPLSLPGIKSRSLGRTASYQVTVHTTLPPLSILFRVDVQLASNTTK
jgi:hypothetical protein